MQEIKDSKIETQHPTSRTKILLAGVGGQGVVMLTNLLVRAAHLAGIPVTASGIYGLSQRGGSVTAGVTLGDSVYGFLEKGGVDILIGLEPLEAQRHADYLNSNSTVIVDNNRIVPFSVNSGSAVYPDIDKFIHYLNDNVQKVIFVKEKQNSSEPIIRISYLLGRACNETLFPIPAEFIKKTIVKMARKGYEEKCIEAFNLGLVCSSKLKTTN